MSEIFKLRDLKNGQKAVISELTVFDDMRRRLQDIGLIEGTVVECVGKSPLGDPAAYLIRGAVIALRSEDSGQVLVCRLNPQEETDGAGRAKAGSAKAHRDRAGKVRDGREREDKDREGNGEGNGEGELVSAASASMRLAASRQRENEGMAVAPLKKEACGAEEKIWD